MSAETFQSTLPYAGSDFLVAVIFSGGINFNPRSPMRGATLMAWILLAQ